MKIQISINNNIESTYNSCCSFIANPTEKNMSLLQEIKNLLKETLQLDEVVNWDEDTEILGAIPEFDSMAIVTVLTMVEENYGIMIEDDEVSAEVFETLGSLVSFISEKVG